MLAVLDRDDLVIGHENELAVFSPSKVIFEGNPGLLLDLSTGNLIGIKLDPFLFRLADFDKDVDGMRCNMHWSTSWLCKSLVAHLDAKTKGRNNPFFLETGVAASRQYDVASATSKSENCVAQKMLLGTHTQAPHFLHCTRRLSPIR